MTSAKNRKRVLAEIRDVNADFYNLRTAVAPAADDDTFTKFYFVMSPNDGAMAHLPVVGCLYIPEGYPERPPVVHLYTTTGRFNVDVYSRNVSDRNKSTLCFDILRSEADRGGAWKSQYTISCLLASLLSAIVSFYVAQEYGRERPEPVTMEKLDQVKQSVAKAFAEYKALIPALPSLPLVRAKAVPATQMDFPETITTDGTTTVTSGPIFLQTGNDTVHTFAADLSALGAGTVFSVVLSNSEEGDLQGKKHDTILVRNGVTATAARKRAQEAIKWFYHGKPMNDGDMRLHVSIGRDQMTFAYYSDGVRYVHGDYPVSRLTVREIGDVRGVPFYVHIFLKKKSGPEAEITLLDTEGQGYIHASDESQDTPAEVQSGEEDDFGFELVDAPEGSESTDTRSKGREDGLEAEGLAEKITSLQL